MEASKCIALNHSATTRREDGRINYFCTVCGKSWSEEDTETLIEVGRAMFTIFKHLKAR